MFMIDRLMRLLEARGFETTTDCRPHEILDMLDDVAEVDTTGGLQRGVLTMRLVPVNPVGARVYRHEELLNIQRPPPLLDDSCNCACCQ